MKKIYVLLFAMVLVFLSSSTKASAQTPGNVNDLPTIQLPVPNKCSVKYFETLFEQRIFWGATPPKPNGKVLLIAPGYLGCAEYLLIGNGLYKKAYDEGYQTAFLAMTRGKGDWVNGEIMSRAIKQVAEFYKVPQIDIIAHSNGGKASEVALFHHGKENYVRRIITLGTPFHGTEIADFGGHIPFSWILEIIGVDAGRAYSTTYYCQSTWRPYFDKLATVQQSKKYYTYGAWGFLHPKELIWSVPMIAAGEIIKICGGGANDGVTPFYSSTRPGANQLFKLNALQGKMNHMDLAYGQHIWANVRGILNASTRSVADFDIPQPENTNNNFSTSSNIQILTESENQNKFIQDPDATNLSIQLIREDANASIWLENPITRSAKNLTSTTLKQAATENNANHFISMQMDLTPGIKTKSNSEKSNPIFLLKGSSSRYMAIASQNVEKPMKYGFANTVNGTLLEVSFPALTSDELTNIHVTAQVNYAGTLDGKYEDKEFGTIHFERKGNQFIYDASHLEKGVYSMLLSGEIENVYKRDLISGFTVGQIENSTMMDTKKITPDSNDEIEILHLTSAIITVSAKHKTNYQVFDLSGKVVMQGALNEGENKLNASGIPNGVYIIQASNNSKSALKFILK